VWTLGDFDIVCSTSYVRNVPTSGAEADAITSKALNDFVQSVLDESPITAMARSASGIAGN
jgi:hypothetical protein